MEFKLLGQVFRLEIVLLCLILGTLVFMVTTCSCFKMSAIETFENVQEGLSNMAPLNDQIMADSSNSWANKAKDYAGGMGYESVLESQKNHVGTAVPLEDTMLIFKDNKFKPECCPGIFSNGAGCACLSKDQMNHLFQRGGNNTTSSSV